MPAGIHAVQPIRRNFSFRRLGLRQLADRRYSRLLHQHVMVVHLLSVCTDHDPLVIMEHHQQRSLVQSHGCLYTDHCSTALRPTPSPTSSACMQVQHCACTTCLSACTRGNRGIYTCACMCLCASVHVYMRQQFKNVCEQWSAYILQSGSIRLVHGSRNERHAEGRLLCFPKGTLPSICPATSLCMVRGLHQVLPLTM